MSDAPKRRWFRFSLLSLLVVVTFSAILSAGLWYYSSSGLSGVGGEYTPQGFAKLNSADYPAICNEVAAVTPEPILGIFVEGPQRVVVETGHQRGPLDGDGHTITLEKRWWKWKVVNVGWWVS